MFYLAGASAFGESHIQRDSRNDRLPGLILRQSPPLDRAPKKDNFFFGHGFEKILLAFMHS
jgi:hypothetical protein